MTATTSSVSTDIAVAEPVFTRQEQLVLAGFLAGYTGLTRDAYALDLRQYANWCQQNHLRLFQVRRADIECFAGVPPAMTWGCPGKHVSRPNRVIGTRPPWRSATVPEFRSDYGRATDAFTLRDQVLKQFLEAGPLPRPVRCST
jgi:hypothetical protein